MNAAQTIKILKEMPTSKSIMLVAKHGVGKSSVVKQVAKDLGIEFHDVRLSQCEVGDIKGLPYLNEETRRTEFLKPYWWPKDPDSKGILFFDELNRAPKDVLQAVFEICLDRRLDGEPLPAGWRVVSAINATDDYDVAELDPALRDRWFIIDFDPSAQEWITWAAKSGIHPSVVDFIGQNPEILDPPMGNLEAGGIYPSRRSWHQFNDTMNGMGLFVNYDDGLVTQICKGWLGANISIMFPKFLANDYSRLKAEDVIENLTDDSVKNKIEAACADIESVAALANSVIRLLEKREVSSLSAQNRDNIKDFIKLIPKDVGSSFWTKLLKISDKGLNKVIRGWQVSDPDFSEHLKRIFIAPK